MPRPPRKHQGQDGTSFFVTTVTKNRNPYFHSAHFAQIACDLIHAYQKRGDYWLSEYVVMPDHIHLLITPKNKPLSACMRNIKRTISEQIHLQAEDGFVGQGYPCPTKPSSFWQFSFHDIIIRSNEQRDIIRQYIYHNPVHSNLCSQPEDYPYSSIHRETDRHALSIGTQYPDNKPPLIIATSNRGKFIEIQDVVKNLSLQLFQPLDFPYIERTPEETGSTCQENALIKARFYFEKTGLPTLADDSGVIVEALKNELGLHTRRWGAGPQASDEEWVAYFLNRMQKESNRTATFTCSLAYIDQKGCEHLFEGKCTGTIAQELEGDYLPGLPLSACFKPEGYKRVYSDLSCAKKNRIGHRGKALQQFKEFLGYPTSPLTRK